MNPLSSQEIREIVAGSGTHPQPILESPASDYIENPGIDIPDFAQAEDGAWAFWNGSPLSYRFNGQEGCFYHGSMEIGQNLRAQIFHWEWRSGTRWGRGFQNWLDVGFVAPDGIISQIALKKDSATNLHSLLTRIQAGQIFSQPVDPSACWIELATLERQTEDEIHYVIHPTLPSENPFVAAEQFQALQEFLATQQFRFCHVGEVEDVAED